MDISNLSTAEILVQATIAVFMIVNPIDPVKIVIFNDVIARRELNRHAAALKVAFLVFCILGVVAVAGRELLELFGINLGAFGVVGGIVVALMGFEMLYGGASSRTQARARLDFRQTCAAMTDCFGATQPNVQHGVAGEAIRERELSDGRRVRR
jgi:small neutral amino acid transporter SnatA (MarC family)